MEKFQIISNITDIPKSFSTISEKFNSFGKAVDSRGTKTSKSHSGRFYIVVDKRERNYSLIEHIFRRALAACIVIGTFGVGALFDFVKTLWHKKKKTVHFGIESCQFLQQILRKNGEEEFYPIFSYSQEVVLDLLGYAEKDNVPIPNDLLLSLFQKVVDSQKPNSRLAKKILEIDSSSISVLKRGDASAMRKALIKWPHDRELLDLVKEIVSKEKELLEEDEWYIRAYNADCTFQKEDFQQLTKEHQARIMLIVNTQLLLAEEKLKTLPKEYQEALLQMSVKKPSTKDEKIKEGNDSTPNGDEKQLSLEEEKKERASCIIKQAAQFQNTDGYTSLDETFRNGISEIAELEKYVQFIGYVESFGDKIESSQKSRFFKKRSTQNRPLFKVGLDL